MTMKMVMAGALCVLMGTGALAAEIKIDVSKTVGGINPRLHSSGWAPRVFMRNICIEDDALARLNLYATRTHDWALWNPGCRIVDTHFIFPLMHLDAANPSNYFFKATDEALRLAHGAGLKTLYRLGSSIEHAKDPHFNTLIPDDFDHYADVMAGIVRHYTQGWADGFRWSFDGWEIWNEPEGSEGTWMKDGLDDDARREAFARFFATVLKRLKTEFPGERVGGGALCFVDEKYVAAMARECRKRNVVPDFISWHLYSGEPSRYVEEVGKMRKLVDAQGWTKTEIVLDEWHYHRSWSGIQYRHQAPVDVRRQHGDGPEGYHNIDSATLNLSVLAQLQSTPLDEAFYYGSGTFGNWGYLDSDEMPTKNWYSMKLYGDFLRVAKKRVETLVPEKSPLVAIAGVSDDGRKGAAIVVDYRGKSNDGTVLVTFNGSVRPKSVRGFILDHTRDLAPVPVEFHDRHYLWLKRADSHSFAYLVTFDL